MIDELKGRQDRDRLRAHLNTPESSRQTAKMNRERLAVEREAILGEEEKRAIAVRQNMARLRELRLTKKAQEVRTEIRTHNQAAKAKPKKRFR
jgi:hypothetical protein